MHSIACTAIVRESNSVERLQHICRQAQACSAPAVFVFDELSAIASGAAQLPTPERRIAAALLAAFTALQQRCTQHRAVLLCTAGSLHTLPPALLQRVFDDRYVVEVTAPGPTQRRDILAQLCRRLPQLDMPRLVAATAGFHPADMQRAVQEAVLTAWRNGHPLPTQGDVDTALTSVRPAALASTAAVPVAARPWPPLAGYDAVVSQLEALVLKPLKNGKAASAMDVPSIRLNNTSLFFCLLPFSFLKLTAHNSPSADSSCTVQQARARRRWRWR